jgi:hypothetical protein
VKPDAQDRMSMFDCGMRNTRWASRGTRTGIFAANRHKSCGLVLYIGRVNTVYCGVDTGLLDDYRDPMLGLDRIDSLKEILIPLAETNT